MNGLSVIEIGGYAFGRPSRVTASVGMGQAGIVNIERESHLSGSIHDKGVLILAGYYETDSARISLRAIRQPLLRAVVFGRGRRQRIFNRALCVTRA